jgi:hypothetical protein
MRVRSICTLSVTAVLAASSVAGVAATGAAGAAGAASGSAVSPHDWSTAPRSVTRTPTVTPKVTGIRAGHHTRFDRIVIDLHGSAPGYKVRYVSTLHRDPSGHAVNLLGPRSLLIVLTANGHDPGTGGSTLTTPRRTAWRFDQVRETAVLGDFEAVFSVGAGLADKTPFRVRTLHHPTRIVVDVHH